MALRIFETDPDAKPAPKPETSSQYELPAFSLRTGMQRNGKPVSLRNWRFVTDNPETASALAELYGGEASEFDPTKEQNWHVLSDTDTIEVVIASADSVEEKLTQWGGPGGPIHECDGVYSLLPDDKGEPCGCPQTMTERKEKARKRRGPSPNIQIPFTLAGKGEDLGTAKFIGTAWTLAEVIHEVKAKLDEINGPALCAMRLELVEYDSDKYGRVSYTKPVIDVLGSYNYAIAEER
jgi:hypothetical protein